MVFDKKQATTQSLTGVQGGFNQPPQFDMIEASKAPQLTKNISDVDSGLAALFGRNAQQASQAAVAAPNKMETGNVPNPQGLAGSLGNYRSMWQPNGGNNYQVVGGVGNII